jgi:cohesin complex subunit SCC1
MREQQDPLALRVSGQLLLGVCRIHSRKQVYLSAEATEALSQIKIVRFLPLG